MLQLELTYPPTVGNYWTQWCQDGKVRMAVNERGSAFRAEVYRAKLEHQPRLQTLQGRLHVQVELWMPDRRKRDLDNPLKALFDACTYAKIWNDDEQIDALTVTRMGVEAPGKTTLIIHEVA